MRINLCLTLTICLLTAGCNSVYVKPNTVDSTKTVYAVYPGGFTMRRSVKERMEKRGYKIVVGKLKSILTTNDGDTEIETVLVPTSAAYAVRVYEYRRRFSPAWCVFNGFWLWDFNVSMVDQKTGEELMTWQGMGCANSSLRKLDRILDQVEIKNQIKKVPQSQDFFLSSYNNH